MTSHQELVLTQLQHYPTEHALALLDVLEERRKQERYVCYWTPANGSQAEIFKQFTADIKIFGLLGGNRSGKTEVGAFIAVAWALGKEFFRGEPAWEYVKDLPIPDRGCNVWVVGLDFNVLRDVLWREKLIFGKNHAGLIPKIPAVYKINESDYQVFIDYNGRKSIITGKSADSGPEKFQGASVDLVWIDEECEAAVFDECYQRTADCAGKLLLTLTPLADINSAVRVPWVHDLYEKHRAGTKDIKFTQLSVLDNPYVPEDEKKKLLAKWAGHPEEQARLYGSFVTRAGLVYKTFNIAAHCVPRKTFPKTYYRIACLDPAPSGPTACAWVVVEPDGTIYLEDTYRQADLIVSEHAKNVLAMNGGKSVDLWLIDPRGGNQRNAETHKTCADLYRSHGIPVRFPNLDEDFGRDALREYINATLDVAARHPKFYTFSDLHDFIDEIRKYVWAYYAKGEMKGLSKERPQKGADDIINCLQYIAGHLNGRKPPRSHNDPLIISPEQKLNNARVNSYT